MTDKAYKIDPNDPIQKARWVGATARQRLLRKGGDWAQLADWELFSRTFGWFQSKAKMSPEEAAAFEDGFKNYAGSTKKKSP